MLIGLGFLPKCRRLPRDEPREAARVPWIAPSADQRGSTIACLKICVQRAVSALLYPLEPWCPLWPKEGYDAQANQPRAQIHEVYETAGCQMLGFSARFGYVNVTDMKALARSQQTL